MSGNIKPAKDHGNLITAARYLRRMAPDACIISLGAPSRPDDLERLRELVLTAGVEDNVQILGARASAASYLNAADVVVNPSLAEGLPVVLLEAMALARPIVATAVGGVPTIIEHEVTGLLVQRSDPKGLASAIAYLVTNPERARDLGLEARRRVVAEFSLQSMVGRVEEIYTTLLRDQSREDTPMTRSGGWLAFFLVPVVISIGALIGLGLLPVETAIIGLTGFAIISLDRVPDGREPGPVVPGCRCRRIRRQSRRHCVLLLDREVPIWRSR